MQSPAAAIVCFQTAKNKNTKQSNRKTNVNKTLNSKYTWHLRPVQLNPAALLDSRKAVTQLQRPLAPTGRTIRGNRDNWRWGDNSPKKMQLCLTLSKNTENRGNLANVFDYQRGYFNKPRSRGCICK